MEGGREREGRRDKGYKRGREGIRENIRASKRELIKIGREIQREMDGKRKKRVIDGGKKGRRER